MGRSAAARHRFDGRRGTGARARRALAALLLGLAAALPAAEPLRLFNRPVAELRAPLAGLGVAERVQRAQRRFDALDDTALAQPVQVLPMALGGAQGRTLLVGSRPVFTLLAEDLDPEERLPLDQAAGQAAERLRAAVQARQAQRAPALWWRAGLTVLAVLTAWAAGLWAVLRLAAPLVAARRQAAAAAAQPQPAAAAAWAWLRRGLARLGEAGLWLAQALLVYGGLVAVLEAFPWTQPWGERLLAFVGQLGGWLVAGLLGAVPGLLTVAVVGLLARLAQDGLSLLFRLAQDGRLRGAWLHPETVRATERLARLLVWGLALAIAYPYLPGAGSEAFRGVSVLFGLMLTLGSTGLVNQLMSGLVLVYARAVRRGDFIAVADVEGVVIEVGTLAVKVRTMRNEEITVPNAVLTSSPIRNYSRLAAEQGTLLSTRVTIGYDAPWRQVHALLEAAAAATPGLRRQPAPVVYQRALGDFYVEYELFAHVDRPLERVAILSALHAAIQDEFNRHGVQIMSPHFIDQPARPVGVPPAQWYAAPARPAAD